MPLPNPTLTDIDIGLTTASKLFRCYGEDYRAYVDYLEGEMAKAIARDVAAIRASEPLPPTVEGLERSLMQAAKIVARYGDVYLPIFLLIEEALSEARGKRDAMARVRAAAK